MLPKKEVKKLEPPKLDRELVERYKLPLGREKVSNPEILKLDPEIMERYKLPPGREKLPKPGYSRGLPVRQPEKPTANAENNSGTQDDAYEEEKRAQRKA